MRKPIQFALLLAVLAWVGLIVLAPYSRQSGWPGSGLIYFFFHQICHQLPERSFSLNGHPLAVCHRCLGIYLGFAAGLLLVGLRLGMWKVLERQPRLLMLFWIPMAVDVFLLPNVWWSRFLTGWLAAFPVAFFVQRAAEQVFAEMIAGSGLQVPGSRSPNFRIPKPGTRNLKPGAFLRPRSEAPPR